MKLIDIRIPALVAMALGLAMMQAPCVNAQPASPEPVAVAQDAASTWQPLAKDKVHDPSNPGIKLLQEPGVALSTLPANKLRMGVGSYSATGPVVNKDGNKVDWAQALRDNLISPRRALTPPTTGVEAEELVMDMDMFLDLGGSMPIVRFPHLAHTMWLACANCHPAIFVPQAGANPISMTSILSGEQCGICHRAVSFPPTDCARCHSISQTSVEGAKIRAAKRAKVRYEAEVESLPLHNFVFVSGSVASALSLHSPLPLHNFASVSGSVASVPPSPLFLPLPLFLPSPLALPVNNFVGSSVASDMSLLSPLPLPLPLFSPLLLHLPTPLPVNNFGSSSVALALPLPLASPVPSPVPVKKSVSSRVASAAPLISSDASLHSKASAPVCGQAGMSRALEIACLEAEISRGLDAYQKLPRRKFVGARTQEQGYAQYIEGWRIKVERIGNLNYPKAARQKKIYGSLQLTVSIRADGSVESVEITRSSGQRILDEAAQRIVELAAPFAPFPPDIHKDIDILSITRTWTFTSSDRLESE